MRKRAYGRRVKFAGNGGLFGRIHARLEQLGIALRQWTTFSNCALAEKYKN